MGAKRKPKPKEAGRPYNTRWLSVSTHDALDEIAFRMKVSKEAVVRQCLTIGISFLDESIAAARGKGIGHD